MVDDIDERVIQILGRDARQSSKIVAEQLNVSPSTVRRRLNNLYENDVIRTVTLVDPTAFGYPLFVIIAFDVAHDVLRSAVKELSSRQEVKWVSTTTGRFDVLIMARFRSTEELSEFMETEMSKMEGIRDSEIFICLSIGKGRFLPV